MERAPGAEADEDLLKAYVKDQLAPYKRPARIVVADVLPASPTGKPLKTKMIETFADALDEPG